MYPVRKRQCCIGWHKAVSPFTRVLTVQKRCATGGGCCANPLSYTRHGFEMHMGVNHLGYAALVDALLPKLKTQVRVFVSSHDVAELGLQGCYPTWQPASHSPFPYLIVISSPCKGNFLQPLLGLVPAGLLSATDPSRAPVQAHPSRVVLFGSIGHRLQRGPLPLDDLHFRHRWYQRFLGYGRSKFAAILFASELSRRCVMACSAETSAESRVAN